jgi:thiamine monophosphate kinase
LQTLWRIRRRSGTGADQFELLPCSSGLMCCAVSAVMRALLAGATTMKLCFTAPCEAAAVIEALSGKPGVALTRIGAIVEGAGVEVLDAGGRALTLEEQGFDHFR